MKKLTFLFILFESILVFNLNAQPITFPWATGFGGHSTYNARTRITRDDVGNIYAVGTFSGTRTFGSFSLIATGYNDAYVAKFDPTGACMWAIKAGGSFSTAYGDGIAIDNNYNIYITGHFTNSITLGPFSIFATAPSAPDIFLARFDNNGNAIWLNAVTGTSEKEATYLHSDGNNLFITGFFKGTATFGASSVTTPSTTYAEIFVAKYDLSGSCTWVNKAGGNQDDKGFCVKTDYSGNVLLTGTFQLIGTFGTNTVTSTQYDDMFVAKYDQNGVNLWVKKAGGLGSDQGYGISNDLNNNIYVAGTFSSPTATFGTVIINDNGYGNVFIAKYDVNGTCLWAKSNGGGQSDQAFDITTDSSGTSYITGIFQGTAGFSPYTITSNGSNDVFVAKYNGSGGVVWATKIGGINIDYGKSIAYAGGGHVIVAGDYTISVAIGSTTLTSSVGTWSSFITEISGGTVGLEDPLTPVDNISFYPNPANTYLLMNAADKSDKIKGLSFYNSVGQLVFKKEYELNNGTLRVDLNHDLFKQGLYFLKAKTTKGESFHKLMIQKE